MFRRIEAQQPLAVAMQHGAGGHHLGVEQGRTRQQTVEVPAMPVGPVHHRGDAEGDGRGARGNEVRSGHRGQLCCGRKNQDGRNGVGGQSPGANSAKSKRPGYAAGPSKLVAHLGEDGVPDGRGLLVALGALISLNLLHSKRFYALLCATLLCYSWGKLSAEAFG